MMNTLQNMNECVYLERDSISIKGGAQTKMTFPSPLCKFILLINIDIGPGLFTAFFLNLLIIQLALFGLCRFSAQSELPFRSNPCLFVQ